jgi:HSP20 family protein
MTQSTKHTQAFSREEFLTPFDSFFDNIIQKAFPTFSEELGVEFFGNNSYPRVDVIDHNDKITIEAEIPGLKKEEVSVDLEENVLTISGLKHSREADASARYIRKELKRSSFQRSFKLGQKIDHKKVKAHFENGILLISVSKVMREEPKKVKIL